MNTTEKQALFPMRINRYLAQCGLGSRRGVEELITSGQVRVNGNVITGLGFSVSEKDFVKVGRKTASLPKSFIYVLFNKPEGCLCSRSDDRGRMVIYDYLPKKFHSLHHVGRLDYNSSGLLLLTNDGDFSQKLLHPSNEISRTYRIKLKPPVLTFEAKKRIESGLEIEKGVKTLPAAVKKVDNAWEITLKEGKNREIRKIMEVLGYSVKKLSRISFGSIKLEDLPPGKARILDFREISLLNLK